VPLSGGKAMKFPVNIRHRKVEAKIYGKKDNYPFYRVTAYVGGKRRMASYGTYTEAKTAAEKLVRDIATGSQAAALTAGQANDALAAMQCLESLYQDTGRRISLLAMASEYAEVVRKLKEHTLAEAADGLPYATLGKLLKFEFQGVTKLTQCFVDFAVDNSIYSAGQSFLLMNAPSITAEADEPLMGTPVNWLDKYGFKGHYARAEFGDQDGDGMLTWQEYIAGTNPTNRQSVLKLRDLAVTANGRQFWLSTVSNRTYEVDWSEGLKNWQPLRSNIFGNGEPLLVNDDMAVAKRYYRALITSYPRPPTAIPGLVWIDPDAYTMGSPVSENGNGDERPQTVVTFTKGFGMGKKEVTQREYRAVMNTNPSYREGDDLPVEQVSWSDATNFCARLTARERTEGRLPVGYYYRLPTEAEWEYACRAGSTNRSFWGNDNSQADIYAWCRENSGNVTHPVGTKLPSHWGLFDMQGNVWEWCQDGLGIYPGGSATDWNQSSTGLRRSARGGSFDDPGDSLRSADRGSYSLDRKAANTGFRIVLSPSP
jgi:formylglycine-generating enzyme required for sulfatase activity